MRNEVGMWTNMDQCRVQGRDVVTMVMYRTRNAGHFVTRRNTVSVSYQDCVPRGQLQNL